MTVLNLDRPLEPDRPGTTVSLDVLKNQGFNLSKNIWETRPGAAQLLAPGSVIADEYLILLDRIERSFWWCGMRPNLLSVLPIPM
ncbi:hypothetical protein NON20_19585 [Synechocystis sp. B12]|nr:hypothetical protein NON20_19585 [Synechocystis sp. B12]